MKWRRWLLQAAVSFAILGILFWILPAGEIIQGISQVPLPLFVTVVLMFLVVHLAAAMKWWFLIGSTVPAATAARAHYIGLAANLCLPGVAGGDAARIAVAWRRADDRSRLAAGSLSDRLIDLMALGCIAISGPLFAGSTDGGLAWKVLAAVLLLCLGGLLIGPAVLARLWSAFPRLPAQAFVARTCTALRDIGKRPVFLLALLLASIAIQCALILLALQLARAAGVEVSVAAWAFAWALAKLIVVLPVSLGGLGVREALLAALLAPYGAATVDVVAGGLAWQAVLFVAGSVGGLLLATSGKRAAGIDVQPENKGHST